MKLASWLRSSWHWVWASAIVIAVVAALFSLVVVYWEWFATEPCGMESRSTTARNVGILLFGLIAIGFGIWRGVVADRQAKASQQQAEISRRSLLNERYQKGAEMLDSKVLSVRLGGIYALQRLAADEPMQYHVQIMELFCAFVRNPNTEGGYDASPMAFTPDSTIKVVREDVLAAIKVIGARSTAGIELEEKENFHLNLIGAYLAFANLTGANLTRAYLLNANLTGTILSKAKGITQGQLDVTRADPTHPPNLNEAYDVETGTTLKWRGGKPLPSM